MVIKNHRHIITFKVKLPITNTLLKTIGLGNSFAPVGHSAGITVNNEDRKTNEMFKTEMMQILMDPNATPEQQAQAQAWFRQNKPQITEKLRKNYVDTAKLANQIKTLQGADRIKMGAGFLTQYIGGDFTNEFAKAESAVQDIIITAGTSSMAGSLSDQDIKRVESLVPSMWTSNANNMGVMLNAVNRMLYDVENLIEIYSIDIFSPEQQKQIAGLIQFRNSLSVGMPK